MPILIPVLLVLDRALRDAGIPIDGVMIGDPQDRATWRAFYALSATSAQRTQGDQILATIDPQDPTTIANIKQDAANQRTSDELIRAVAQASYEVAQSPATFPTLVSYRNRIRDLFRNLL